MKNKTPKSKAISSTTAATAPSPMFVRGQTWQLSHGTATILHVGKRLVEYKFLKTGMIRGPLELTSISNLTESMKANKATLIS